MSYQQNISITIATATTFIDLKMNPHEMKLVFHIVKKYLHDCWTQIEQKQHELDAQVTQALTEYNKLWALRETPAYDYITLVAAWNHWFSLSETWDDLENKMSSLINDIFALFTIKCTLIL